MRKVLGILGLFLVLVLVACGGGDDDDDDSGGGEGNAATATAGSGSGGDDGDDDSDTDDDGDDEGSPSDFHACSLFTAEEISAVLKAEVNEGRDYLATAARATQCIWETDDAGNTVYIEVLLDGGQRWYDAVHIEGSAVDEVEEIEGLGDEALWDTFLGTLDVVEDDRYIAVQPVLFFSDLEGKEVALELARMALERLP